MGQRAMLDHLSTQLGGVHRDLYETRNEVTLLKQLGNDVTILKQLGYETQNDVSVLKQLGNDVTVLKQLGNDITILSQHLASTDKGEGGHKGSTRNLVSEQTASQLQLIRGGQEPAALGMQDSTPEIINSSAMPLTGP